MFRLLLMTLVFIIIAALPLWSYSAEWGIIPSAVSAVTAACLYVVQVMTRLVS
jgi:hypothetical protein